MNTLVQAIAQRYHGDFMTVGITGSVAVGKSTFAANLAEALAVNVAVVSTDDFLMPNATLMAQGLFDQKGFPQTYILDKMAQMIADFQAGQPEVTIPLYRQDIADIDPQVRQTILRPDILIIEGVVALQLAALDFKIYLDAALTDIKTWYLSRTLAMTAQAKTDPTSWRYQFAQMPVAELSALAMTTWEDTNQVNLDRYILPMKPTADAVVNLDQHHQITRITIK